MSIENNWILVENKKDKNLKITINDKMHEINIINKYSNIFVKYDNIYNSSIKINSNILNNKNLLNYIESRFVINSKINVSKRLYFLKKLVINNLNDYFIERKLSTTNYRKITYSIVLKDIDISKIKLLYLINIFKIRSYNILLF